MTAFDEAVEKKIEDPHGKLTCLIKYTTGEVKEMVKISIQLPPKEGYETAKQMMHNLYGDVHRVIAASCKEIKQWSQIKPGDAAAYRNFHHFLQNICSSFPETLKYWVCVQQSHPYLMGRRCHFSLGWQPF